MSRRSRNPRPRLSQRQLAPTRMHRGPPPRPRTRTTPLKRTTPLGTVLRSSQRPQVGPRVEGHAHSASTACRSSLDVLQTLGSAAVGAPSPFLNFPIEIGRAVSRRLRASNFLSRHSHRTHTTVRSLPACQSSRDECSRHGARGSPQGPGRFAFRTLALLLDQRCVGPIASSC